MRLSLEGVFGKFEVLRICFGKEDTDIGNLRKIGLLENIGLLFEYKNENLN